MGLISSPSSFTAQPQYPAQADYAGLGKGAALLLNPGAGFIDSAFQKPWTPSGSAAITATPRGKVLRFDQTATCYASLTSPDLSNAAGTFAIFATRIGAAAAFGHVWLSTSTGNDKYYHIYAGENQLDWGVGGGSTTGFTATGKIFNTVNTSLVFTTNGSGGAGKVFYLNGVPQGTGDATAPTAFSAGANSLVLGKYWGGTSWNVDADIFIKVYFPGVFWGQAEAKLFHASSGLAVLKAPDEEIWIAPTGGSAGSSSGIASVSGVGASLSSQPGSSSGIAAASGIGASLFAGAGAASGIAAVSGIGASNAAGVGASNGIAAASGVGSSIAAGSAVGAAAGIASVSGIGASIAASIGSAYGSSSVNGVAGGAPSSGGHYAGVAYTGKRPRRDLVDRDREDIKRLIREQLSEAKAEIAKAEVPQEVKQQARAVIKPYQKGEAVDVQALQQEVIRVRNMLHMWEQQVRREREEDEELLFMFH